MRIIDALADLLLGAQCPGCDEARWGFCPRCRQLLETPPFAAPRFSGLRIVAANPYRPLLSSAIPRYKDDGGLHLEQALALRLAVAVAALDPPSGSVLVPVPSLARTVRARGFDHGIRLAERAGRVLGLRAQRALRRGRSGRDQQGLGAGERASNLAGAMRSLRRVRGPVVLVDDIVTTGASLREARRALLSAGVKVLGCAVIADADAV